MVLDASCIGGNQWAPKCLDGMHDIIHVTLLFRRLFIMDMRVFFFFFTSD